MQLRLLRNPAAAVVYSGARLTPEQENDSVTRQLYSTNEAPAAIGPYSQAVASGGLLFCSGQLGIDPETMELAEGLGEQVTRALNNLRAVLGAAGAQPSDVVKTTVFLAAMEDFGAMNEIYAGFFTEDPPARSTVAVRTLPKNALFEIEAVAQLSD
jgi:2-iminobutanoate/2-iminopropanoate deaminase